MLPCATYNAFFHLMTPDAEEPSHNNRGRKMCASGAALHAALGFSNASSCAHRYCLCCGEIYFYARRTGRHPLPSEHFATALRQSGDVHLGDDDGGIMQP